MRADSRKQFRLLLSQETSRTLGAIILLVIAIILFFWKLVFTHQFDWIWGPDLSEQVLPWFEVQAREFHAGHLPLWDSSFWGGQPLFGQTQPGAAYPFNWMLFVLPLDAAGHIARASLEWYFVLIHIIAGVFTFALIRDLGLSRGAGIVAGLSFALGGYVGQTGWPQMLNGAVWAPLIFLFAFRIIRGEKPYLSAVWAGVFQGCAWLSGHHEIPMYTSIAVLFLCLWAALRGGIVQWRVIRCAALFSVFALGTGAFQILPSYEYGPLAMRFGAPGGFQWNQYVPYAVHVTYSLSPIGILGLIFATLRSELVIFVGVVALAIGLLGAIARWAAPVVRQSSAIAISGLLYALGGGNVIQGAMYAVIPELNRARHPESAILLFDLGLAVLVAFGVDALPTSHLRPQLVRILVVFGVIGYSVITIMSLMDALNVDSVVAMAPLTALLLAGLLWSMSRGLSPSAALIGICVLLAIELGAPSRYQIIDLSDHDRTQYLERMKSNVDVAAFLKQQAGPFRIKTDGKELPDNWAGMFGFETSKGYLGGITNNIINLDVDQPTTQVLLGVKYRIARETLPLPEVFQGKSGLRVFRDDAAFPRAWLAQASAPIPPGHEKSPIAGVDVAQLRTVALTHSSMPSIRPCEGTGEVTYISHNPSNNRLHVTTPCDRILVVAETWYPGWKAWIDGSPSQVEEVDGALQGLFVPAGAHTIDLKYRPRSVFLGGAITIIFIAMAALCEVRARLLI